MGRAKKNFGKKIWRKFGGGNFGGDGFENKKISEFKNTDGENPLKNFNFGN